MCTWHSNATVYVRTSIHVAVNMYSNTFEIWLKLIWFGEKQCSLSQVCAASKSLINYFGADNDQLVNTANSYAKNRIS